MVTGIAGFGALFSHVARIKAESGLAAISEIGAVPRSVKEQFVHQVGSGAGHQVAEAVPSQFQDTVPVLTRVADSASIDALNSMAILGTVIGAVSVVIAVIAFEIDHGRTRRSRKVPIRSLPAEAGTDSTGVRPGRTKVRGAIR